MAILEINKEYLIDKWKSQNINKRIIQAFKRIKREDFVLKEYKNQAYNDIALPIGYGATISQPSTVILMLHYLNIKEGNKVLEIGAGSGYNAALMSKLVGKEGKVFSFEIISELAESTRRNLKKKGITNVELILGDGSKGYEKEAPFDRITITAACEEGIPQVLIGQLKNSGKLIAPVGKHIQRIILLTKSKDGKISKEDLGEFLFVPMKRL